MNLACLVAFLLFAAGLHAEPFGKPHALVVGKRTQLEFADNTLVRLGANARFDYTPGTREISLDIGTMLLSSPKGAGGAIITSGSTVTTISAGDLEMSNINGTVKVICLTGKVQVRPRASLTNRAGLRPGEMVEVLPGATGVPTSTAINLGLLLKSSGLIGMAPLPSQALMERNARKQKPTPILGPPGANAATAAMSVVQITAQEQQQVTRQLAIQQAADTAAAQEMILARRAQQQVAFQRQQQEQAAAQQRAAQGSQGQGPQGSQGQGVGVGGTPPGQGNQGKKPPAPPGQNK